MADLRKWKDIIADLVVEAAGFSKEVGKEINDEAKQTAEDFIAHLRELRKQGSDIHG